jgi:hypothetical protein
MGTAWKFRSILALLLISVTSWSWAAILVQSPNGTATSAASFAAAASAANDKAKTVIVTTPVTLAANLTWPSDRTLKVVYGGSINVPSGITLTINGSVDFPLSQVFTGSGSVTGLRDIYLEYYGAALDGTTDDTTAIDRANTTLAASTAAKPCTLHITGPTVYKGTSKLGAITLTGVSGASIDFGSRGKLLMDNLSAGKGTTSGLFISGPATEITINNPYILWPTAPSTRSTGDGITVKGYPADENTVKNISILGNAYVKNAPQTGAIFMGVSKLFIESFTADNTRADGLHFNACQHVKVNSHFGIGTGDDALALVTYYHASSIGGGGTGWATSRTPYNQSSLGEWSNYDVIVGQTTSTDSSTDGVRIAGSYNASINGVQVDGAIGSGVIIDAGVQDGVSHLWSYLPSKLIKIGTIRANDCAVGLHVNTYNTALYTDYSKFDVNVGHVITANSGQYSAQLEYIQGVRVGEIVDFDAGTTSLLINASKDLTINALTSSLTKAGGIGLAIGTDSSNITLGEVNLNYGSLLVSNNTAGTSGINIANLTIQNTAGYGAYIVKADTININRLKIYNPNTTNAATYPEKIGLFLGNVKKCNIGTFIYDSLVSNYVTFSIGNGVEGDIAGKDITITNIRIRVPDNASGIVVQTGDYAPINIRYNGKWQNTATGVWTSLDVNTY